MFYKITGPARSDARDNLILRSDPFCPHSRLEELLRRVPWNGIVMP
jgi:hypothetical protein